MRYLALAFGIVWVSGILVGAALVYEYSDYRISRLTIKNVGKNVASIEFNRREIRIPPGYTYP